MFDSFDFFISLTRLFCHLIDCLLNTIHNSVLEMNFMILGNNLFDFVDAFCFDFIQLFLYFFVIVKLFIQVHDFVLRLINDHHHVLDLFWFLKISMIFSQQLSKLMVFVWFEAIFKIFLHMSCLVDDFINFRS